MTEEQIKYMVSRFLAWRLPENFSPDDGISFKAAYNEHTAHPMKHEPVGTNLLDAMQAEAMVRHMLEGMPDQGGPVFPQLTKAGEYAISSGGMSLRDWLAGQALIGISGQIASLISVEVVTREQMTNGMTAATLLAYGLADAMLAERAK